MNMRTTKEEIDDLKMRINITTNNFPVKKLLVVLLMGNWEIIFFLEKKIVLTLKKVSTIFFLEKKIVLTLKKGFQLSCVVGSLSSLRTSCTAFSLTSRLLWRVCTRLSTRRLCHAEAACADVCFVSQRVLVLFYYHYLASALKKRCCFIIITWHPH